MVAPTRARLVGCDARESVFFGAAILPEADGAWGNASVGCICRNRIGSCQPPGKPSPH